jgi:hypothetical protein
LAKLGTSSDGVMEFHTPIAITTFFPFFFFDIGAAHKNQTWQGAFFPTITILKFCAPLNNDKHDDDNT